MANKSKKILLLTTILFLLLLFLWINVKIFSLNTPQGKVVTVRYFGHLLIFKNRKIIFQSDSLWKVKNFFVADLNNDKEDELSLVIWKKGSFGKILPFWLKENDKDYGFHLFLYKFQENRLVPFWHSSKLEKPICEIKVIQNTKSVQPENILAVQEGSYVKNNYSCQKNQTTNWRWNGWGFTKI